MVLEYAADGLVTINKQPVPIADLQARLTTLYQDRRDKTLFVMGDGRLPYGRIVEAIDKKGLRDSTLIVFSSDNGGHLGLGANNDPLRGAKNTLYEGGVRVPTLVVWPGKLAAGGKVAAPLHMTDWYPTILSLAGAPLEQPLPIDGKDIWPTISKNKPSPHDEILINVDGPQGAIRRGNWKLVDAAAPDEKKRTVELFDLDSDPNEKTNLAEAKPDIVADLKARLQKYSAEAATPLQVVTGDKRPQTDYRVPKIIGVEEK